MSSKNRENLGTIEVIDVRGLSGEERQGIDYIGRDFAGWKAAPLGNPFKTIAPYKEWLWAEMRKKSQAYQQMIILADKVQSGQAIRLGCWCKSKGADTPCHGDVVKAALEWIISERVTQPVTQPVTQASLIDMPNRRQYA